MSEFILGPYFSQYAQDKEIIGGLQREYKAFVSTHTQAENQAARQTGGYLYSLEMLATELRERWGLAYENLENYTRETEIELEKDKYEIGRLQRQYVAIMATLPLQTPVQQSLLKLHLGNLHNTAQAIRDKYGWPYVDYSKYKTTLGYRPPSDGQDSYGSLLSGHKLRLVEARYKRIINNTFPAGIGPWVATSGDWHFVTIDTNVDKKPGIEDPLLINAAGSYYGGVMEREVTLREFGEIIFEFYIKNDDYEKGGNRLKFYIDDQLKLDIQGPAPWRRCEPIGIGPGRHKLKFEYTVVDPPGDRSVVIDNFDIWEGKAVDTLISKYTPAKPLLKFAQTKTLRGYTRVQEMNAADTEVKFSIALTGPQFRDFISKSDKTYYYIDEFGVCYRGTFITQIEPELTAMDTLYYVALTMLAQQKAGVGFV